MKQVISILIVFFAIRIVNGQTVPSFCTAPDSIKEKYMEDAQRLAVLKIFRNQLPDTSSINIPVIYSNPLIDAMLAVYNATSLPARDTVINMLDIHTFPWFYLNELVIEADYNLSWMQQLHTGIIPTGYLPVDTLISSYNLQLVDYYAGTRHRVLFRSTVNYNIAALGKLFDTLPGVNYAFPNGACCDGNNITDSTYTDHIELAYIHRWGEDCLSGCDKERIWKFNIFNDCSVEFVGSYGSIYTSTTGITAQQITIAPNPFDQFVQINGINGKFTYSVIDLKGRELASNTSNSTLINLSWLQHGLYFIQIQTDKTVKTFKLLKE